jgi:hypothetical protein
MQRRRQRQIAKTARGRVRRDKRQLPFRPEQPVSSHCAAEMLQIRAAAEAHMLTVVERFAGVRVDERPRPSAESLSRLQQRDRHAAIRERHGRSQPRQPAADDDHPFAHSAPR